MKQIILKAVLVYIYYLFIYFLSVRLSSIANIYGNIFWIIFQLEEGNGCIPGIANLSLWDHIASDFYISGHTYSWPAGKNLEIYGNNWCNMICNTIYCHY